MTTVNKKLKWESVGKVGEVTKAVAQTHLEERKKQIRLCTYGMMTTEIPTLSGYKDEYLVYKRDILKNRSWKRDRLSLSHLNEYFAPCQRPPRNMVIARLTSVRRGPRRLPPSGMYR